MPKICYKSTKFGGISLDLIRKANLIIDEYRAQGYILTLRQLYYQFVSRDWIPNTMKSYKRLASIINDARLGGMIDWNMLEDRTRNLKSWPAWENPAAIIAAVSEQFALDKWNGQEYRPEVWIEKEALAGVFDRVCEELQVPYFCCRGYTSQSEMWSAAMRLRRHQNAGYTPIIFHFGDHDPSGVDMTRDIVDRLEMFTGGEVELKRLALTMEQVDEHKPPPNPAKITDSRAEAYIRDFGKESWELDALKPALLSELVTNAVLEIRDEGLWNEAVIEEEEGKRLLGVVSKQWDKITRKL